jgi:hypothetical protein
MPPPEKQSALRFAAWSRRAHDFVIAAARIDVRAPELSRLRGRRIVFQRPVLVVEHFEIRQRRRIGGVSGRMRIGHRKSLQV